MVSRFWKASSENCPETRREIAQRHRKNKDTDSKPVEKKRERRLFAECGRPYSLNEAKLGFKFKDEKTHYELDLEIYK